MAEASPATRAQSELRTGVLFALAAYGLWGVLPAYFKLIGSISADVIVAHRVIWSMVFVGGYLAYQGRLREILAILRTPRLVGLLLCSALIIGGNWLVFVWAIGENRVLDISLGYFINPLVSVVIGLVVLGERLSRIQTIAVGLAIAAVMIKTVLFGGLPWVGLVLAVSFAAYGYLRKVTPVGATAGMLVEILLLLPLAVLYIALVVPESVDPANLESPWLMPALAGAGLVTAVPLIFFSAAARRLPLVIMGLLQYLAPSLQFLQAVFVWGEPLDPAQLGTFAMIWAALALVSAESWRRMRAGRGL
ncbi:EamA family transporter RarD [Polymorphum gilvum]|uniref:RarD protein, DMT superfamily transporter n=1 Tax=Polymorphum gilvum (strain LMG 25793 / CGMCC 1.9160 / SL003B-26A1) TaxID=991905 RepID=F2J599_POLGS|nr:EamA family transporter RarD [Polymorphum gilvum]ADZ71158.1 RarD protein, DMT superfamily transporter [Polymorphum gilvum SL003B-26A1]